MFLSNQTRTSDNATINNNINGASKEQEILDLKNELNKAKKIIEEQKVTINELQDQLQKMYNNNISNIKQYQKTINLREHELNYLKSQLQNINSQNKVKVDMTKEINVHFLSVDHKINYFVPCNGFNTFAEVEEELYKQYPEYRETNNNFITNGEQVLKFKTISQNKIDSDSLVTMIMP